MSEELKPAAVHDANVFLPGSLGPVRREVVLAYEHDRVVDQLRTELATLKAGQGEAVAYAYEYGKDNGDGSFSVTITRGRIPSYLTPVKDWPVKPLYLAPPASADAVSVPRELLKEATDELTYFDKARIKEDKFGLRTTPPRVARLLSKLRALLAQSESKG